VKGEVLSELVLLLTVNNYKLWEEKLVEKEEIVRIAQENLEEGERWHKKVNSIFNRRPSIAIYSFTNSWLG
jgi:hypothetical protein